MEGKHTSREDLARAPSVHSKKSGGSGVLGDFGSRSDLSSIENEEIVAEDGFIWKSQTQHAMYFIAYTFSWGLFSSFRKGINLKNNSEEPSWLQVTLAYIVFAGPMLYLQIFIGQFTHQGCIILGSMLPIAYGIGYSMIMNTLITCSLNIYFCGNIIHYTLVSMLNYPTPAWMLCLPEFVTSKRCFSRDNIDLCKSCRSPNKTGPCFNPQNEILSASLFMDQIVFYGLSEDPENLVLHLDWSKVAHLLTTIVLVLILSLRSLKDLNVTIKVGNIFAIVVIIITTLVLLLNQPEYKFIANMLNFRLNSFLDPFCWTQAFLCTALRLNIMEGGHFLFGSYMPLTVNCNNRVLYILFVHFVLVLLTHVMVYIMEEFVACSLNMEYNAFLRHFSDFQSTFALYPTALGLIAAAQLWATLYFFVLLSLCLHSIVIQIIFVEETLSQVIINPVYRLYTRVILILICSGPAIFFLLVCNTNLVLAILISKSLAIFIQVTIFYLVILLYGLDKVYDDIHFILHSPPSKYLKWSWIISFIIITAIVYNYIFRIPPENKKIVIIVLTVIFIPMPIGFIYQLYVAIKAKELSLLLKATDQYGPKDTEERNNRKLFNPRYEVRFRRRHNVCKHRCLLNSVTLKRCLEKELIFLTHVILDIEENEEERITKREFVNALKIHKEIMMHAINFDPKKTYFLNRSNYHKNK